MREAFLSTRTPHPIDAVIFGGGIAGLWTLHAVRARGLDAVLVEAHALGHGQSVQAQGIIHGGGKYALRSVGDLDAVRAIRDMPERWRMHAAGELEPDLRSARLLSAECWLWLPRRSWMARLEAMGLVPVLRQSGLLATAPRARSRSEWPAPLRGSAVRAYSMAEPVFDTASVLAALATPVREHLLAVEVGEDSRAVDFAVDAEGRIESVTLRPRGGGDAVVLRPGIVVLTAGAGNAELLQRAGREPALMQRRPLRMFLLRGRLRDLHGHCVSGGRTRITVTSAPLSDGDRVWQVGGEIAERESDRPEDRTQLARARDEIARRLPGLDLSGLSMSSYRAVRAEGRHPEQRRPSGVQLQIVTPNLMAAWPTKWALAPLLAEEIADEVEARVAPARTGGSPVARDRWPRPQVARPPWEEVAWSTVASVAAR